VEAVLDPTWQNPYTPSSAERETHQLALRHYGLKRKRLEMIAAGVLALALVVGAVVTPWLALVGIVLALGVFLDVRRYFTAIEGRRAALGSLMQTTFEPGGTSKDRQRLITVIDRLTATFGVDTVSAFIINDEGYNASLVPNGPSYTFFVTNAMMRDFELIELEGVVAHCLARQRLGILDRESCSAVVNASVEQRRELAGPGLTYRADEVAAAAIRYPLGLAGALRRCARQVLPTSSFFSTSQYDQWRFIWFDVWSDRIAPELGDLDDVELRALALEEW
jgi:Zn-dependent protease with chaperone function